MASKRKLRLSLALLHTCLQLMTSAQGQLVVDPTAQAPSLATLPPDLSDLTDDFFESIDVKNNNNDYYSDDGGAAPTFLSSTNSAKSEAENALKQPANVISEFVAAEVNEDSLKHNQAELCHLENGDDNIVLDIFESDGNNFDQPTSPGEMPIVGDPSVGEIELDLVFPTGNEYFRAVGKALRLVRPLDRDENDLSSIVFQVTCTVVETRQRRTIPVIVRVSDLNDNTPRFVGTPYSIDIPESTPVNTLVFRGLKAEDPDSGPNGLVIYTIVPGDGGPTDGFGMFSIDLPHQGFITVSQPLDFEATPEYILTVEARDQARDSRAETTLVHVNIMDSDDIGPTFSHPVYTARVPRGVLSGALDVRPDKVQAVDGDSLRAEIRYSVKQGSPEFYNQFFSVDQKTGVVRQIKSLDADITVERFELLIVAEEKTPLRRRAETKLIIKVEAVDTYPPVLSVSAKEGYVSENSEVGTRVVDKDGNPIQFTVTDQDISSLSELPGYSLELTSDMFAENPEHQLIVNTTSLDRDPPSQPTLMLQVVAHERNENGKSSGPVTLLINIRDENDNAPLLPSFSPFTVQPGNTRRLITNLNATDIDEDDTIRYRITQVTNGGKRKFYVNPTTGDLEVIGNVLAGEVYSITITAKDEAGSSSSTTVEVNVSQGPNLRPPVFEKLVYDTQVSEGGSRYDTVARILAKDPEGGLVTYSILSGNNQDHFSIEESSGVIRVNQPLDREDTRRYTLTVMAEDEDGKGSTATVNIIVTDINDENPTFVNTPYSFRVKEGEAGAVVGKVLAEDKDSKENANVTYSISDDSEFEINELSGEIKTKSALDFEKGQVHYVVITANDGAKDPRLATATATVLVQDVSDETPYFPKLEYEAVVPENIKDFIVTTVKAKDKDSVAQITYRIMSGELDKFKIIPETGEISTIQGLDYERRKEHVLVIGTEQAMLTEPEDPELSHTCTVKILVEDVNDLAPQFINVPTGNTLYVRNDLKVQDVVGRVGAEDGDGTKPGNIVMFDLDVESSSEAADQYFRVDQTSGEIILLGDLSNEVYDQYKLTIRAFDQGTPSLSSTVDIMIRVEQVVTLPPNTGIGFTQLKHTIQALENTPQEAVLKTLPLMGIPKKNIRIRCSVRSAVDASGRNVEYLFKGVMEGNQGCNLVLARSSLDYEVMKEYRVEMEINTLTAFLNPLRAVADLVVEVVDKNDNSPVFVYDEEYHSAIKDKYISTIRLDTQVGAEILQVKAKDLDSGNLGKVNFEIASETATPYFKINPETGVVSTNAAFEQSDLSQDDLPFRLAVIARDNPGFMSDSKMTRTEVVINVLLRDNIFILVLRGQSPSQIRPRHDELAKIMSEPTDLIVSIDRSVPMLSKDENGTCCTVSETDTDVWFYALDPVDQKLLAASSNVTRDRLTGKQAQTSLKYIVTGDFHVQASDVHSVFDETPTTASTSTSTTSLKNLPPSQYSTGYPAVLIAIGCLVFACSFAAILYLLILYTRYKRAKDHSERMVVIPRYEPVFVEPNLKQYETQVLQMSVNIDDIDNGLAVDFRNRNYFDPGFNLDNVSYITHETNSTSGSPVQDPEPSHSTFRGPSTPSFRAATVSGRPGRPITRSQSNHKSSGVEGTANPAFQDDQNLLFHGRSDFNTSTPKHSHSFKTPRDATTQL